MQRARKHLQQNPRRNVPQPKERDGHKWTGSLENTKWIGPEKKFILSHTNQNTKYTEPRLNIKSSKGKRPSNI